MLWYIFTYIITRHRLGGFSGFINGLIAAAISALSMLTSEPTAKSNVKRTRMFVLSLVTLHMALVKRCGRRGGLMVSTLDSKASGPGSSPGLGHGVFFFVLCC